MSSDPKRSMLIYGVCLPVALLLACFLVNICNDSVLDGQVSLYRSPLSAALIGLAFFLMILPLLLRWYHPWLIAVWQSALLFVFLPGNLQGWTVMAIISFGISIGHYILNRERKFLVAPAVSRSLIFIAIVVAVTAKFRGGIGLNVLGNEAIGGKRYILIWVAILGYFAITSQPIAPEKRKLMTLLFMLGGATAMISDIAGLIGGPISYIGYIFPLTDSSSFGRQSVAGDEYIARFGGLANGSQAIAFALAAYYGIEGLLNLRKLWRPALFFGALFVMTYGGFRGLIISAVLTLGLVFYFEGLFRSRYMPIMVLGFALLAGITVGFSDRLPLQFQRGLAFLPLKLDSSAKESAESSSDWRLEMWEALLPQIPNYLWLGKGLGIEANDLADYWQFGNQQVGGEVGGSFAAAGDYHNGPLSLIIQFGIWGVLGFLWFLGASLKVLWSNYKYGDPDSKRLNTFLLAYFISKTIMFFAVFGSFYTDIMIFTGIVGFSVSLNSGVARPSQVARPKIVFNRFRPLPAPATAS